VTKIPVNKIVSSPDSLSQLGSGTTPGTPIKQIDDSDVTLPCLARQMLTGLLVLHISQQRRTTLAPHVMHISSPDFPSIPLHHFLQLDRFGGRTHIMMDLGLGTMSPSF
jgi:hypothetical protein